MTKVQEEMFLQATALSEGVAIGMFCLLKDENRWTIQKNIITPQEIPEERARYKRAITASKKELHKLLFHLEKEGLQEAVSIIETHIQMLEDSTIHQEILEKIAENMYNVESIFAEVMQDYVQKLSLRAEDIHHIIDIQDFIARILRHLNPQICRHTKIPRGSILYAHELMPSKAAEASLHNIRGFITQRGGITSHAALIARSKKIPYISNVETDLSLVEEDQLVIIDGYQGLLIVHPLEETIKAYKKKKTKMVFSYQGMAKSCHNLKTEDQVSIQLQANLENFSEVSLLKEYKVPSIGLCRSEFLYVKNTIKSFKEEEQYELYKKLLILSGNMSVTLRLFDLGNEKVLQDMPVSSSKNPALGYRSIRFLLANEHLLRMQVRAIYRASYFGNVQILLPFITDRAEVQKVQTIITQERERLQKQGALIAESVPIGCMIEVPSSVFLVDQILQECDFLSIGTNDLLQYTLAIDRAHPEMIERYGMAHPSLLRMIEHAVKEANRANKPINICGEIASYPQYTELLVGLGVRTFSISPRRIPPVREAITQIDTKKAEKLVQKIIAN